MDLSCFKLDEKTGYVANLELGTAPPEEVVQLLAGLGYRAVSWSIPADVFAEKGKRAFTDLVDPTRANGLTISEINVEMDLVVCETSGQQANADFLMRVLEAAADTGIASVKTYTGPVPWNPKALSIPRDISEGEAWHAVSHTLNRVLPLAEDLDVEVNIEAVFGHLCHDYYSLRQLIQLVDSPKLGVVMDPSHLFLYDNDIPWAIRQLGEKVRHVHVKDVVGRMGPFPQSFVFPLLGEGQIQWTPFLEALDDIGYRGFFTLEFESFAYYRRVLRSDPELAARVSYKHFRDLCRHIEADNEYDGAQPQSPWMK
ncbi:MAG: sugar phosphate isomerase/epimerase [Candidatus Latescibacteria bacterium]|jgi:sugar phosphate isomerase/epimerase|nr:sugar phosphate isomerase/epimerase [Candidatus Latescibacterota bacterium]